MPNLARLGPLGGLNGPIRGPGPRVRQFQGPLKPTKNAVKSMGNTGGCAIRAHYSISSQGALELSHSSARAPDWCL